MANAVFTSSVTYTPGGGGSLTQGFRVAFAYSASSAGTIDVAAGVSSPAEVPVPFGTVGDVLGFVLKNNTLKDIDVKVGANSVYKLAAGGVMMHFSPDKSATSLASVKVTPATLDTPGTIDFIVLGN